MQKCKVCNHKLRYKDKLWSIFWFYSPIICEGCGSKYYVRFYTRIICACLIALPVFLENRFFSAIDCANGNMSAIIGGYLIWGAMVLLLMPFGARYYLKDDGYVNCH